MNVGGKGVVAAVPLSRFNFDGRESAADDCVKAAPALEPLVLVAMPCCLAGALPFLVPSFFLFLFFRPIAAEWNGWLRARMVGSEQGSEPTLLATSS